jgi:hypothetical protein
VSCSRQRRLSGDFTISPVLKYSSDRDQDAPDKSVASTAMEDARSHERVSSWIRWHYFDHRVKGVYR